MPSCAQERLSTTKSQFSREVKASTREFSEYPEPISRNESPMKSAVGIMLTGCVVDSVLPGVPANRLLRKGDLIAEIGEK